MDVAFSKRSALALLFLLLPLLLFCLPFRARTPPPIQPETPGVPLPRVTEPLPTSRHPWSLAEARTALERQPDNLYLQYVVLQLARQENQLEPLLEQLPALAAVEQPWVELYQPLRSTRQVFLAWQRQLLLADPMPDQQESKPLGWRKTGRLIDTVTKLEKVAELVSYSPLTPFPAGWLWPVQSLSGPERFALYEKGLRHNRTTPERLEGPTATTRDWERVLQGKAPAVSPLSRQVPADFYLAEFRSLDRLLETLDTGRSWSMFLSTQLAQDATQERARERVQTQLILGTPSVLSPFVDQVAFVGSDPYLDEGSDVTLLFQLRDPQTFQRRLDGVVDHLLRERRDAHRSTSEFLGIEIVSVTTPDRSLSLHAANPKPNLHVRGNSPVALRRVLETVLGRTEDGQPVQRLGEQPEFHYARSLLPAGDSAEDGLLFFSEAFLRRLTSPELRIKEARRLISGTHLRMIAHAAQLYRTQFGTAPSSLEALTKTGCAPGFFNEGQLACPAGGTYRLSLDGTAGVSTVHGSTEFLTPCIELPLGEIGADEAAGYEEFVEAWERSGPGFFQPVAVRLHFAPRRLQAEAVLLTGSDAPLHQRLTQVFASPAGLEPLPVSRRSVLSVGLRLQLEERFRELFKPKITASSARPTPFPTTKERLALTRDVLEEHGFSREQFRTFMQRGIDNQVSLHVLDAGLTFDVNVPLLFAELLRELAAGKVMDSPDLLAGLLVVPVYVAIPVKDGQSVDDFLAHLDTALPGLGPDALSQLTGLPGTSSYYQIDRAPELTIRSLGVTIGPARWRLFWTRIGNGLYLSNQLDVLDDVHAAHRKRLQAASTDQGPVGQAHLRLRSANLDAGLPGRQLGWAENHRVACQRNLALLTSAARAFSSAPPVTAEATDVDSRQRLVLAHAARMFGHEFVCPDGGQYQLSADGKSCFCTVHGTLDQPRQPAAPAAGSAALRLLGGQSDLSATITAAPAALRLVVTVER